MTDYRALCAELVAELECWRPLQEVPDCLERARAALAEHQPPTGEVGELVAWLGRHAALDRAMTNTPSGYCRAADPLERLAQPAQPPTRRQLMMLADDMGMASLGDAAEYARAVLARWGFPAPQPIPISERLPGPEDCDERGRCWWLHIGEDGVGDWFQRKPYPSATNYAFFRMTHWLPAHALPVPGAEVEG